MVGAMYDESSNDNIDKNDLLNSSNRGFYVSMFERGHFYSKVNYTGGGYLPYMFAETS